MFDYFASGLIRRHVSYPCDRVVIAECGCRRSFVSFVNEYNTPQCCSSSAADHVGFCLVIQFAVLHISSKLTLSCPQMIQRSSKLVREVVG